MTMSNGNGRHPGDDVQCGVCKGLIVYDKFNRRWKATDPLLESNCRGIHGHEPIGDPRRLTRAVIRWMNRKLPVN